MRKTRHITAQVNSSSMADIAFLLLTFFMVTTTIKSDQGLDLLLPPHRTDIPIAKIHERNLFSILISSEDRLLVENEIQPDIAGLRKKMKTFILNNGKDEKLSDSPKSAIISIKTNRGTSQAMFIDVLDEVKASYYEIYADFLDTSTEEIRNGNDLILKKKYNVLKTEIPMNISIAEPGK